MKEQINTPTRTTTQTNSEVCELEQITEKTCNSCIHFGACSKWTDFPKQCGVPVCASFAQQIEWISVTERLPEVAGREYLVWDDIQATVKKRFFHRIPHSIPVETYPHIREYFGNASDYRRYTHWMPLPEPPKMKGGEE